MRKLPAAHVLVWERGTIAVSRYWQAPRRPRREAEAPPRFDEAAARFWDDFREAVARHRRADVPLGVFLSGGSTRRAWRPPWPSSSRRGASGRSRSGSRTRASTRAGTPGRSPGTWGPTIASGSSRPRTCYDLLPEVAAWLDEPFGDASILPTHLLSRFARTEVTVALGGDGADELLAGYPTFAAERAAGLYRRLPAPARALAGAAVGRLPVDHGNLSLDFRLKQFLRGAAEPSALAHQRWLGSFSGPEIAGSWSTGGPSTSRPSISGGRGAWRRAATP